MMLKTPPDEQRVEEAEEPIGDRWYDQVPAPGVTTPVQRWDFGRSRLRRWLRNR